MPRTKNQIIEIRKQKTTLIKQVALELFANQGYYVTSISKIAKAAKISKGLIYNYFESKEALITEIILEGFDVIGNAFDRNKDGVLTNKEFTYFIDESFLMLKSDTHFWKLYFSVLIQPVVMQLVQHKLMQILTPFLNTTTNYYKSKGVENPVAHARFLGAILDGIALNYIADPEGFPVNEIKKILIEKFV